MTTQRFKENDLANDQTSLLPTELRKIRLIVVDDHPVVRLGLSAYLGARSDIEIVGTPKSGQKALTLLGTTEVDVALIDLRMPGLSGIETLKQIALVAPQVRCLVLSSFEYDEEIHAAVAAGARGYVHKESRAEEILNAIRTVFQGKLAFPQRISERLASEDMSAKLSSREREILELVAKGLTNKEVAALLNISHLTARNHLKNIAGKLHVSDRTEAIFVAIQTGLISMP